MDERLPLPLPLVIFRAVPATEDLCAVSVQEGGTLTVDLALAEPGAIILRRGSIPEENGG